MTTNKTVFFLIGILLIVLGTSMLAPYLLQIILKEGSHSFISASFVTIFIGMLFILANLEKEFKLNLKQTFPFFFFGMGYDSFIWKFTIYFIYPRFYF